MSIYFRDIPLVASGQEGTLVWTLVAGGSGRLERLWCAREAALLRRDVAVLAARRRAIPPPTCLVRSNIDCLFRPKLFPGRSGPTNCTRGRCPSRSLPRSDGDRCRGSAFSDRRFMRTVTWAPDDEIAARVVTAGNTAGDELGGRGPVPDRHATQRLRQRLCRKDSGRYKVANCTQAQPVFYGFAGLPDGKVILVSVLSTRSSGSSRCSTGIQ